MHNLPLDIYNVRPAIAYLCAVELTKRCPSLILLKSKPMASINCFPVYGLELVNLDP